MTIPLELLSPAGTADIGMAAIDHGADAVYIGGPSFSARSAAGNTISDIAALVTYARPFAARVYAALNTILSDAEIPQALSLIRQLYDAGVDGLIIQDVGLLECDLPPIPLIASTQMHIATPEKAAFLEGVGFQKLILARELSLKEIGAIRKRTTVELETFVHGALCVSYSGQCYMSQAAFQRSGNRGRCAQPCRHVYTLTDADGKIIKEKKHLLSLKDLNLTSAIPDLVGAGITSFKIEGRYKDAGYVKNVTAAFRLAIDRFIAEHADYRRASSGKSALSFQPDLEKTFNRGYTRYFLYGRKETVGAIDTPKSLGKAIGTVMETGQSFFRMTGDPVRNGDGLCFFTDAGLLSGFRVNRINQDRIYPNTLKVLKTGMRLYRNRDHAFSQMLEKASSIRRVGVSFRFSQNDTHIRLEGIDEDGNQASAVIETPFQAARNPEGVREQTMSQLSSAGNTIYSIETLLLDPEYPGFLPMSTLNRLRRETLDRLTAVRVARHGRTDVLVSPNAKPFPEKTVDFQANVLNRLAETFYARHGARVMEPALEAGGDPGERPLMTTRYCIRHQLDLCPRFAKRPDPVKEPLFLSDGKRRYRLRFDCERCHMSLYLEKQIGEKNSA